MKQNERTVYACLLLLFSLWGSQYVVGRYVLTVLPTFTVTGLRFAIAYVVLRLLTERRGEATKTVRLSTAAARQTFAVGFVGYFIAVACQMIGIRLAGAGMAALINALNPITIPLMAAVFLREKLTAVKISGAVLAVIGVYFVIGGTAGNRLGILFSLLTVLLWSGTSLLTRRLSMTYPPLLITRRAVGVAALCCLPLMLWELASGQMKVPSIGLGAVIGVLYIGIFCTGLAYFLWSFALSKLDAGTCAAFYPVQPVVATALGSVFLGETVRPSFLLGAGLIMVSLLLHLIQRKQPMDSGKELRGETV